MYLTMDLINTVFLQTGDEVMVIWRFSHAPKWNPPTNVVCPTCGRCAWQQLTTLPTWWWLTALRQRGWRRRRDADDENRSTNWRRDSGTARTSTKLGRNRHGQTGAVRRQSEWVSGSREGRQRRLSSGCVRQLLGQLVAAAELPGEQAIKPAPAGASSCAR